MRTSTPVPFGTNPTVNGQFDNGADVSSTVPSGVNPQTGKFYSKLNIEKKIEKKTCNCALIEKHCMANFNLSVSSAMTLGSTASLSKLASAMTLGLTASLETVVSSITMGLTASPETIEKSHEDCALAHDVQRECSDDSFSDRDFRLEVAQQKFDDQTRGFSMTPREREEIWRFCVEEVFGEVCWHKDLPLQQEGDSDVETADARQDDDPSAPWEEVTVKQPKQRHSYLPLIEPIEAPTLSIKKRPEPQVKRKVVLVEKKPPTPARWACMMKTAKRCVKDKPKPKPKPKAMGCVEVPALDVKKIAKNKTSGQLMIYNSVRHPGLYTILLTDGKKFGVSFSDDGVRVTKLDIRPPRFKIPRDKALGVAEKCGQRVSRTSGAVNMSPIETVDGVCAGGLHGLGCVCGEASEIKGGPHTIGPTVNTEIPITNTKTPEFLSQVAVTVAKYKPKTLSPFGHVMQQQLKNSSRNVRVPVRTPEDMLRDSISKVISIVCKRREWLHNHSEKIKDPGFRGIFERWLSDASRYTGDGYHQGLLAVFLLAKQLYTNCKTGKHQLSLEEKEAIRHVLSKMPCPQDARRYLNKKGRGCSTRDCCFRHFDTLVNDKGTLEVKEIGISVDGDRKLNHDWRDTSLDKFFACLPSVLNISSKEFPIKFRAPTNHQVHESLRRYGNSTIVQGPSKPEDDQVFEFQGLSNTEKERISSDCDPVRMKRVMVERIIGHPQLSDSIIERILGDREEDELVEVLGGFSDVRIHDLLFQLDNKEARAQAQREAAVKADEMREKIAEERTKRERLAAMTPEEREDIAEEERKRSQEGKKARKAARSKVQNIIRGSRNGWQ